MDKSVFDQLHLTRPTLILDEAKAKKNIATMAAKAKREGIRFRPHFKTHQSAGVAEWFRQEGVDAITVSSLAMADYFADHGWRNITVAFPTNPLEIDVINRLAEQIELHLLVDQPATVKTLAKTVQSPVSLWIKVDTGYGRAGIPVEKWNEVLTLAQLIEGSQPLRFAGLLAHAGHSYNETDRQSIQAIHRQTVTGLQTLKKTLLSKGIPRCEVSVGDTPCCSLVTSFGPVDEIRPGNFVFYDVDQVMIGSCSTDQIAVALACPVVAKYPHRKEVIIYGGGVHFAKDYKTDHSGRKFFGWLVQKEEAGWGPVVTDAHLKSLSQEHGVVHLPPRLMNQIEVGQLLIFLPVHICLTANLHRSYCTLSGTRIQRFNSNY